MKRIVLVAGAAVLFASGASAGAGEAIRPDPGMGVAEVVDAAMEREPMGQALAAERLHAEAMDRRAGSYLNETPSVGLSHQNDTMGSDTGFREWEGSVELPLRRSGLRQAAKQQAETAGALAERRGASLRLAVAGRVREVLWRLAEAREQVAIAEKELTTARELEAKIETRLSHGDVPRTDLLLAREETLQREADVDRARLELGQARAAYRRLTGLDRRPAELAEPRAAEASLQDHPDLAAARAAMDKARAGQSMVREQGRAQPTVGLNLRSEDDGVDSVESLGVSVSIPVNLKSLRAPDMARAGMELAKAQADYQTRQREIRLAVEQAAQAVASARALTKRADRRLEIARENLRIAEKAYSLGETSLMDLLRVRSRSFNAERHAAMSRIELHRAVARYNQAMGVTP